VLENTIRCATKLVYFIPYTKFNLHKLHIYYKSLFIYDVIFNVF